MLLERRWPSRTQPRRAPACAPRSAAASNSSAPHRRRAPRAGSAASGPALAPSVCLGLAQRTRAGPRACAAARAAHRRAPSPIELVLGLVGRPRPRRGSRGRSARSRGSPPAGVRRRSSCRRSPPPRPHQPRPRAQRQHLAEQLGQRPLVAADETARSSRDRGPGCRRSPGRRRPGDSARSIAREERCPRRIRVQQQRDHHRRLIRRRGHDHRRDRRRRTPPDPSPPRRRSQTTPDDPPAATRAPPAATETLLAITCDEVLRHPGIVFDRRRTDPVCATAVCHER